MGPHSTECGNRTQRVGVIDPWQASMGPHSTECGNGGRRGGRREGGQASMGPHSTECGNLALEEMTTAGCAASMGPHSTECGNCGGRSRARDRRPSASMGPHSTECGNGSRVAPAMMPHEKLQWGRTQLSAEIFPHLEYERPYRASFNGAALN